MHHTLQLKLPPCPVIHTRLPLSLSLSLSLLPTPVGPPFWVLPYQVCSDPAQHWVYFSAVTPQEAILLKTFDSQDDGRTARFSLHSAFELPEQQRLRDDGREPLRPRASMEVRVLVLWGADDTFARNFVPPHMRVADDEFTTGTIEKPLKVETLDASEAW